MSLNTSPFFACSKIAIEAYCLVASPIFFSRITQEQSRKIENCQKKAFAIILQSEFRNYDNALSKLNQKTLEERRVDAALKFGERCVSNPRHSDMFPRNIPRSENVRRNWKPFKEFFCRTERFFDSSIPVIARLLNEKYAGGYPSD